MLFCCAMAPCHSSVAELTYATSIRIDCVSRHRSARVGIIPMTAIVLCRRMFHPRRWCIIHTMTCFWWQLAHNITIHIMRLSLKQGCFEINVEMTSTSGGSYHLATSSEFTGHVDCRRICMQVILLFVLESSQCPPRRPP